MPIISPGSEYERNKNDRTRVNNLTGFGTPTSDKQLCNVCQVALRLKQIDGVNKMWCSSCNNILPVDSATAVTDVNSKYTSRYGSTGKSNFFIISQSKKKKTADEIQREEARRELGGRDGLTVVDSKESVYGEGGWTG